MRSRRGVDVLLVSVGATAGWRAAARELAAGLARAGATVLTVSPARLPEVRTFMLTDLVQALAARRACERAIAQHEPTAIIYCSITAALLWPRPGAIWLDSLAAENRPGRHGVWQRIVERRRLAQAPLVLTWADTSLDSIPAPQRPEAIVVPVPVSRSGPAQSDRDIDVLGYAADPDKRRLRYLLASWERARCDRETLVVAGIDRIRLPAGLDVPAGVTFTGLLAPDEYRRLLRRARVYAAAPRREDYGIAPLEALADGCMLVSTPSPGPYPALSLARTLDPRLVADDLAPALRTALDDPVQDYAERAAQLLVPFSHPAVDETIGLRVVPRLLPGLLAS
jgi:hypothetical protein